MGNLGNLNVQIGADLKPLEAGLATAKTELTSFGQQAAGSFNIADASLKNLYAHLDQLEATVRKGTLGGVKDFALLDAEIKKTTAQIEVLEAAEVQAAAASNKLAASNTNISSSFAGVGRSLTSGLGSIRQLAYILPGIGVAGIFNVIFEGVTKAADAMGLFSEKTVEASKATQQATEDAAKQIISFRELTTVAADENQSREVRLAAIKKLRNEYGPYLKDLSDEQILSGNISTAIKGINEALQAKILLQAGEEKLLPIIKAQLEARLKEADATKLISQLSGVSDSELRGNTKLLSLLVDRKKAVQDLVAASGSDAEAQKQVNSLFESLKDIISKAVPLDLKIDNQIAKVKELKAELDKLPIGGFGKAPVAPKTAIGQDLLSPLIDLGDETLKSNNKNAEGDRLRNAQDALAKLKNQLKDITVVAQGLGNAFSKVFTDLVTKGKISFQGLAQALTQLLQKLVATVIEAAILSAVLGSITGGGSSILGGAGFKNIFKSLLGGGLQFITPHAEGGVFTGPTQIGSHLFGEAGPEFLVGQDKLARMLQTTNGARNIELSGSVNLGYNTLAIAFERANKYRNRNYGGLNG